MVFLATPFFFSSSSFGNIFRGGGVETRAAKFVKIREEWYGISEERNGGVGIPRHWLFPLLNEIILSKICRVQRKMIFFVGGFVRGVKEDFWKKIYLSIKIERLILFFFYIETELQIREDYGIFMGFDWFKGIIIDALSVKENGTYVCPEMDTSSDSWGIVEIGNACQAICLVSTWHKARAHGTDK